MSALTVRGVHSAYGPVPVLRGIDLDIADGSITAIVGPSGCGKTTLLRVIAGFESPDPGSVFIDDRQVCGAGVWVPPHRRGLGYVAQDGALFPHLTVAQNIGFGLPRAERRSRARITELLELVSLDPDYAGRRPDQLSGGQQQRVSLARALAPRPGLILLDEPFSALDAGLRTSTRAAVAEVLAGQGVTTLLVTHDQSEALSFADQVGVMRDGLLTQIGPPREIYEAPLDLTTAAFVGEAVTLPGVLAGSVAECALGSVPVQAAHPPAGGAAGTVLLRPEQIELTEPPAGSDEADPAVAGVVEDVDYYGHDTMLTIRLDEPGSSVISLRHTGAAAPDAGAKVGLRVRGAGRWFPGDG
ncbi:MAG TPA: ABC transporter ATP-binding protein [Jatrophihabitans sp.]|uniref:ABC transporter ATP-binding protein n=1 Tax=Jatrophihabitans sp. TaxID=1932789 RepID=UPI002F102457